jgi:hypothetical protein
MSSVLPTVTSRISSTKRVGLAVAHAGGRLVEQDHVGAAGDGDADLERALLGIGQQAGQHVALAVAGGSSSSSCSARSFSVFRSARNFQNE